MNTDQNYVAGLAQHIKFVLLMHPEFLNNNIGKFKQWLPDKGTA